MNHKMVRYSVGRNLLVSAVLMAPSLIVALIYKEGWKGLWPFLAAIALTSGAGAMLCYKRPMKREYYAREGFVIVALTWFSMSFFGSLPFLFSGSIISPVDAFFETASGLTTTGASILSDIEALPNSVLWWRSFTHLIGGMGILIFTMAVMPKIESDDVFIMRAEVPGPIFGKVRAKLGSTARTLYIIYLTMTGILVILLLFGGMPLYDSFIHAFGAAGTGGFSIKSSSVGCYDSAYFEYVLGVSMILFGVNFNLYYALLFHHVKDFFKNEELRWYISIIIVAIVVVAFNVRGLYDSFGRLIRDVFFTVSSIMTTTGYTTANFDLWPVFSKVVLLFLMFVGGMAGSTAGGFKISRVAIYVKSAVREISRNVSPNRRLPLSLEGKPLSDSLVRQSNCYLTAYIMVFALLTFITALSSPTFVTAFSAVAATINNIGPGLDVVGPAGNYANMATPTKLALSVGMIMGRLEVIPVLVLFSPRTWRKG